MTVSAEGMVHLHGNDTNIQSILQQGRVLRRESDPAPPACFLVWYCIGIGPSIRGPLLSSHPEVRDSEARIRTINLT